MASPPTPDFGAIIARVAQALASRGIPFMLIGGQAVLLHGEPRLTQDIDITLGVSPDRLDELLDVCARSSLQPLPEDPRGFARRTFVLPTADIASRVRVDLIFSTTPYERQAIDRALNIELMGQRVPFASAEDVILHKLFAGRPRDLEDASGIVRRKGSELDWDYLRNWATEFSAIPGREDIVTSLESLRRKV